MTALDQNLHARKSIFFLKKIMVYATLKFTSYFKVSMQNKHILEEESEGFWRWCMIFRITGLFEWNKIPAVLVEILQITHP
jgi:hypothetical protein